MRHVDETITRLVRHRGESCSASRWSSSASAARPFVRLALRPLNRVADTAARVVDLPLSSGTVSLPDRVPEPDPHTEVGHVADAFNHMLEHVESSLHERQASEERLRRFIADASHELRTPVAVIRSHAELAPADGRDLLPADVARALRPHRGRVRAHGSPRRRPAAARAARLRPAARRRRGRRDPAGARRRERRPGGRPRSRLAPRPARRSRSPSPATSTRCTR